VTVLQCHALPSTLVRERETLPLYEEPMTTVDFITHCSLRSMSRMRALPKHPRQASGPVRWSRRAVHALKGVGNRACPPLPWLTRDFGRCFPRLPARPGSFASSGPLRPGRRPSRPPDGLGVIVPLA